MASVFTQGYRYPKDLKQGLRYLNTHAHSSVIHNSQKVETAQTSINRWMHKWNADYTCNRILYFKADTRLDLKCSYYKKEMTVMWSDGDVSQHFSGNHIARHKYRNQHMVCFKLTQCYMSIISQFFKKENYSNLN